MYEGETVPKAAGRLEISKTTGYEWLDSWNEDGLAGLEPAFGGGRPSKLAPEELEELEETLSEQPHWTTNEVHEHIKDTYGVDYSERNVYKILHKLGMTLSKPYQNDYRRPDDADDRLKKT